jgi:hypothetical protein
MFLLGYKVFIRHASGCVQRFCPFTATSKIYYAYDQLGQGKEVSCRDLHLVCIVCSSLVEYCVLLKIATKAWLSGHVCCHGNNI